MRFDREVGLGPYRAVLEGVLWSAVVSLGVLSGALGFSLVRTRREMKILNTEAARLSRMAMTDPLTGLANRRLFHMRLRQSLALARRRSHGLALVVIDLDDFKRVNDAYGHPTGDRILRAVARELRKDARAEDLVARQGGEEFALILEGTDAGGALARAERLRRSLGGLELGVGSQRKIRVTASFGIVAYPEHCEPRADVLIARADAALYAAKAAGRNASVVWGEPEVYTGLESSHSTDDGSSIPPLEETGERETPA